MVKLNVTSAIILPALRGLTLKKNISLSNDLFRCERGGKKPTTYASEHDCDDDRKYTMLALHPLFITLRLYDVTDFFTSSDRENTLKMYG